MKKKRKFHKGAPICSNKYMRYCIPQIYGERNEDTDHQFTDASEKDADELENFKELEDEEKAKSNYSWKISNCENSPSSQARISN